jgi:hypothetical protein
MRLTPLCVGVGFCVRGVANSHALHVRAHPMGTRPRPRRSALALLVSFGAAMAILGPLTQAHAATFGKTTVGALTDDGMFANYKIVHKATLSVPGSVTKLSLYAVPGVNSPSPQVLKAVIYSESGKLLATGIEVTYRGNVNGSGWLELPLASPVERTRGTYWIGFIDGNETEGMGDEVANTRAYNTNSFCSGPTDPFGSATKDAMATAGASHPRSLVAKTRSLATPRLVFGALPSVPHWTCESPCSHFRGAHKVALWQQGNSLYLSVPF